jgi:hypothetical protein
MHAVDKHRVPGWGVPPGALSDDDLQRELASIHRTRNDTLRHGSDDALAEHDRRMAELEAEYLRRFPEREVDPSRLRE